MADFQTALAITLDHEKGFFHNTVTGEVVNMGITLDTLRSLGILKTRGPATPEDIAFVKGLTAEDVSPIYRQEYWDKLQLDKFVNQAVANKVFDLAVNTGTHQATMFLQRALRILADGQLGPLTLSAANSADPQRVLDSIRSQGAQFYRELAANNPELAPDLPGWLARLDS